MNQLYFRPRFRFTTSLSMEEIQQRIDDKIKTDNSLKLQRQRIYHHIILHYPKEQRKFWTPQLDINLETTEEGYTMVRCLIGPAPAVWTLVVFAFGTLGLISLFSLLAAFSQLSLGHETYAHYPVLMSVVLATMLYFSVQQAKQITNDEMHALKLFLDDALGCDCFALAIEG